MTKLFENKQIIHIAIEVIIIAGIVFYFSSKNKKLLQHIENLSQRLEEQDELLQKHEKIINQLVIKINNRPSVVTQNVQTIQPSSKEQNKSLATKKKISSHVEFDETEIINKDENKKMSSPFSNKVKHVEFADIKVINEDEHSEEYSSENESDLDAEIADELNELEQEDSLKKKNL